MRSAFILLASVSLLPACFEVPGIKTDVSTDFATLCEDGADLVIDGDLDLSTATDADVAMLTCVTEVTGTLTVSGNTALTGLVGLESLGTVGGLVLADNTALLSLRGLDGLSVVGTDVESGEFQITNNPSLTTLAGLGAMNVQAFNMEIADNASLCDGDVEVFSKSADLSYELYSFDGNDGACPVYEGSPVDASSDPCDGVYSMTVNGDVYLGSSATPASLDRLRCVTAISGVFSVGPNDSLTDLSGLGPIGQVGSLVVADLPNLTQIDDLGWLVQVDGDVAIGYNDALESVNLGLGVVGGALYIHDNAALTSLWGLTFLKDVGGGFTISNNDSLESLWGCCIFKHISSDLIISDNDALTSLGNSTLSQIDGQLQVVGNDALTDLSGLKYLKSVGGVLWIAENENLDNLTGLSALETVGGMLGIHANPSLGSIAELSALTSVGSVQVDDNPYVCSSQVDEVFSFFDGYIYNEDNGGC